VPQDEYTLPAVLGLVNHFRQMGLYIGKRPALHMTNMTHRYSAGKWRSKERAAMGSSARRRTLERAMRLLDWRIRSWAPDVATDVSSGREPRIGPEHFECSE
jgi:hypothetical protein